MSMQSSPMPSDAPTTTHAPVSLSLADIDASALTRDRMIVDHTAMQELIASVRAHGIRSAIEVMALPDQRYALVSGFRRLQAAAAVFGPEARIPAIVLPAQSQANAYRAMVEENEIRADLSPYERGRIAAVAVSEGVFPDLRAAVDGLFAPASKAKRSKIRAFARVHEWLGDLLSHPHLLGERMCLSLARAMREHGIPAVRAALRTNASQNTFDPADEAKNLAAATDALEANVRRSPARHRQDQEAKTTETIDLGRGLTLRCRRTGDRCYLGITGGQIDDAFVNRAVDALRDLAASR